MTVKLWFCALRYYSVHLKQIRTDVSILVVFKFTPIEYLSMENFNLSLCWIALFIKGKAIRKVPLFKTSVMFLYSTGKPKFPNLRLTPTQASCSHTTYPSGTGRKRTTPTPSQRTTTVKRAAPTTWYAPTHTHTRLTTTTLSLSKLVCMQFVVL